MISYLWSLSNILYNTLFIRTRMPYKKYREDTILLAGQAELALLIFYKRLACVKLSARVPAGPRSNPLLRERGDSNPRPLV